VTSGHLHKIAPTCSALSTAIEPEFYRLCFAKKDAAVLFSMSRSSWRMRFSRRSRASSSRSAVGQVRAAVRPRGPRVLDTLAERQVVQIELTRCALDSLAYIEHQLNGFAPIAGVNSRRVRRGGEPGGDADLRKKFHEQFPNSSKDDRA
jgi:hypothetical protein